MAAVSVVVLDADDEIWWEMPPEMVDRLLSAETTNDYAIIGRQLKDAVKHADECIARNLSG